MAGKDHCGSFGADLTYGTVAVPKLLLQNYTRLGLQDGEFILLLQLIGLRERMPYPTPATLAELLGTEAERVENMLGRLIEQEFLSVEKVLEPEDHTLVPAYSMIGLMEKLSEIWAQEKAKAWLERTKVAKSSKSTAEVPESVSGSSKLDAGTGMLVKSFEKEFGRPLTEIECSNIIEWHEGCHLPSELILEALKRAVLNQTTNWRYINSILQQWYKKNFHSLQEVFADDARFQASRQTQAKTAKPRTGPAKGPSLKDKYKDIYL
ncbi:MAG: DnaD domain protein [Peptococcaceae bacterium]|nr:DnaD domain protein [Peptococcaceae bacterium]